MPTLNKESKRERLKVSLLLDEFKPEVLKIEPTKTFYNLRDFYTYYNKVLSSKFTENLTANNVKLLAKFDLQKRSIYLYDYDNKKRFRIEFAILTKLRKAYNDSYYYTEKGFIFPKVNK